MKRTFLLSFALFFSFIAFSQEQSPQPIIFITDASGSMWQKVGGAFKIDLARQVLGDLVSEMPENQSIGLVAYGHRQKGDCGDIEALLPSSNLDKAAFQKALQDLNPLGKTPLAQSARLVIEKLKSDKQSATIILITDGIETCEGDLCEIVKEAKAAGIDFVMHIIGFDLGDADRAPLECAARESEGLYIDASDKEQLSDALDQASDLTVDIPKGKLAVECKRNGELVDGAILVYKTGTDEDVAGLRSYSRPKTNPAIFNIPAGEYDVEVTLVGKRGIAPMKKRHIVVTDTTVNEQVFDFTSGHIELTVTEHGVLHDATVNIRFHGGRKAVTAGRTYTASKSNPLKKELTPGIYDVDIKSVKIKGLFSKLTIDSIEIKAGQTTSLAHGFESATLLVGTSFKDQFCDASVNIISLNPKKAIAGGRTYSHAKSNPKSFLLSPGEYEVEVRGIKLEGDPREKFSIKLEPGDKIEKIIKW